MPNLPWTKRALCQLTLIGVCDTNQIVNTHHFEATTAQDIANASDAAAVLWSGEVADHWLANAKTEWLACHGNDYTLNLVKAQVVERNGLWRHRLSPVERTLSTANVGTASYQSGQGMVSIVIRWRTPQASKATRGRSYVGPIPAEWMVNGQRNVTESGAVPAYAAKMIAQYGSGGAMTTEYNLTIYSRPYNEGDYGYPQGQHPNKAFFYPPDYAGNSTWVTTAVVDPILRVQRRRELGVGS